MLVVIVIIANVIIIQNSCLEKIQRGWYLGEIGSDSIIDSLTHSDHTSYSTPPQQSSSVNGYQLINTMEQSFKNDCNHLF